MSKLTETHITQEMMEAATKVFVAIAVQTNSTNTTVKFTDFSDDEDNLIGDFTVSVKWKRPKEQS